MSLVLLAGIGWAADACSPPINEFRHFVTLTGTDVAEITDSYRFNVPTGECPAIVLPHALDGMAVSGSEASVVDGRVLAHPSWTQGQVLVVSSSRTEEGGPFSAELRPPRFPVSRMVVQITSPLESRLDVWAEPGATVDVSVDKARTYRATLPGGGRLVWSTYEDWWDVGRRLEDVVATRLVGAAELGELSAGLDTMTVADALDRASRAVAVEPSAQRFEDVRPLGEVLRAGRGSAAERAMVLLSLLRAGGHDARPALVRPAGSDPGSMSVPADALFSVPAVVVRTAAGLAWIDPRSPYVGIGEVPTGFRGASALAPGDYPIRLHDDMVPDGKVFIDASGTISEVGDLEVSASVSAERGGLQGIRDLLAPLSKDVRQQWLTDLLTAVRPNASKVRLQVFGVEDPTLPLGMTIEFVEEGAFAELGSDGMLGVVEAVLAPQLARVLPPNIDVTESVVLKGTGPFVPYGVAPVADGYDPDTLVSRVAGIDGDTAVLHTDVLRPWRASANQQETELALFAAAGRGPKVVLFGALDHSIGRELREEANNNETRVLEALLWYHAGEPEEAEKSLRKTVRTARFRSLLELLRIYTPRGEMRPWDVVWDAAPDDFSRLAIVEALEAKHERREAWRRATELVQSEHASVRIEALVAVARVQGERPAASVDEEAHRAWREPQLLLKKADKLATEAFGPRGFQAVHIPMVVQMLARDECAEAEPTLQRALEDEDSPLLRAVESEWHACMGHPDAGRNLTRILSDASYDPVVVATVVRTYERLGRFDEARRWAVIAAHLANDDAELWLTAARAAERAGDLRTASYSAGRGSDLQPKSLTVTVPYQILATLAGDAAGAARAHQRSGYQVSIEPIPVSIGNALTFANETQRLGLLRLRDADVLQDRALLEERYKMHLSRGDELGALRDAAWLNKHHKVRLGPLLTYQATSPSVWSTASGKALAASVREPEVRKTRMELSVLTGITDPLLDARLLPEDPTAKLLMSARGNGKGLRESTGWSAELKDPAVSIPDGFKKEKLLSVLDGVVGMTNRAAGASLLVCGVEGRLPPPMEGVFQLGPVVGQFGRITLHELQGGSVPAFAATRRVGGLTWWGVARSEQLARFAVEAGIAAQSIQ